MVHEQASSLTSACQTLTLVMKPAHAGLVKYRRAFPRKKVCNGTGFQKLLSSEADIWCTSLQCCSYAW